MLARDNPFKREAKIHEWVESFFLKNGKYNFFLNKTKMPHVSPIIYAYSHTKFGY